MKFQPKRFVVEVKRGTSRASFSSLDIGPDKFSSAEAMLFGSSKPSVATSPQQRGPSSAEPARRILESLVEPTAPVVEDEVERPRRGRKPGSKNKPKPAASLPIPAEEPRRLSAAALAFMKGPGVAEQEPSLPGATSLLPGAATAGDMREGPATDAGQSRRARLRERSSILKRYVLGTEPKPGQPGSLRARRQARAAR